MASFEDIDAFKYLTGILEPDSTFNSDFIETFAGRLTPISKESFELQQNSYNSMTNEYLDMFAWSSGKIVNQYFAEEIDGTKDLERIEFIIDDLVNKDKN